ncbi:MAG: RHS repeat-associated core domain-containing protein [Phycisphaerales bacterium]|nr:RHS repeat-associated core domain-containing protein [Phycisphaerales bacterium]
MRESVAGTYDFGYVHVGARYYDPAVGRFLQRDPIGLFGGFNVYAYCANNPVSHVDPTGEFAAAVAAGGAPLGGGLASLILAAATATSAAIAIHHVQAVVAELSGGPSYKYDDAMTVSEILRKHVCGGVMGTPLPPGGPGWDEILKMTWAQIKAAKRAGEAWARTVYKLLTDRRFQK